ncbi:MAG TPA: PKD domain-containing protein, partial [Ruminiclostridium sp.]|nr:PKD domain-containing protein [Ruminiclostridium sp.]
MRNIIKSIINVVCIVIILMNSIMLVFASGGGGGNDDDNDGNILNIAYDTDKRQSFSMVTDSVSSNSSQQGFCVGWTFEFSSIDGNTSTKIYVPIKNPDTNGGTHTYIMPLSNGWKGDSSNIDGGSSIFSLTTYQYTYSLLIKQGCKVTANARIEKFSYNSYTGKYTSMGVYADNPAELKKVFSGFSDDFITNTIKDYFNWSNTLDPEPQTVHIQYWDKTTGQKMSINQADVTVASSDLTTRTFEPVTIPTGYEIVGNRLQYDSLMPSNWDDYSIWDKTIHFPLDGLHLEGWLNIQMALKPYTNTVHVQYWDQSGKKLNINQSDIRVKDNKSVTKGFVLSNEIPAGYKIIGKKLQHIPDLPRDWEDYSKWDKLLNFPLDQPEGYLNILLSRQTGIIHIACIDSSNNEVIDNRVLTASLNIPQIVSSPEKSGYSPKGSYSTFITNSSVPSSSNMQRGILSQSVTLSEAHPDAYVYFWYDKVEGPVAVIDAPTTVQAGEKVSISGSHSYTKQSGIKITKYDWDIPGGNASFTTADGETVYNTPGTYTIHLTVTDSNGLTGSTTHVIEVTPPIPTARMEVAGKIKENRKITVDARNSDSPQNYSI